MCLDIVRLEQKNTRNDRSTKPTYGTRISIIGARSIMTIW